LAANTQYYLISGEYSGGDQFYSYNTAVTTTSEATVLSAAYTDTGAVYYDYGTPGSNSYGPVGLLICGSVEPPPTCDNYLLTGATFGTLRNNYGGWVGHRFQVGASPMEVAALGRIFVTGNSASHALRLVRASDGVTVASATWTPAGGVNNQMKYVDLGTHVTLAANTAYFLASEEVSGGDAFYSWDTAVTTTSAASVLTPVYSNDGTTWVPYGTAGSYTYGPVGLVYCDIEAPPCGTSVSLMTGASLGTLRNNYSGWVGNRFRVGASTMRVTALGRMFIAGNTGNHAMRLVRASDGVTVASATWTPAGGVDLQIKYVDLASEVALSANTEYFLASQEVSGGDSFYSYNTAVTTTSAASVLTPVYSNDGTSWVPYGTAGSNTYGPVTLKYCSGSTVSKTDSLELFLSNEMFEDASGGEDQAVTEAPQAE